MRNRGFILAIDSFLVRKGMVTLLNHIQGVSVIREFDAYDPLFQFTKKHGADFLIISQSLFNHAADLFLIKPNLLEKTIVLILSPPAKKLEEVHTSISIWDGNEVITETIKDKLRLHSLDSESDPFQKLTRREETIVRLVSMGLTNKQIAQKLFLSTHTVTTHRRNIIGKLGIKSVSGLTVYAIVNNIITIDEVTSKPDQ